MGKSGLVSDLWVKVDFHNPDVLNLDFLNPDFLNPDFHNLFCRSPSRLSEGN